MELDNPRFGLTWKEKMAYLGFKFADASEDGVKCPVTHRFEPGMYIREMFIPAQTLFIGRPHLQGHRCELVSGKILMITEEAKMHMDAPAELHSKPGYMMCMYTKTDVVGRTYHPVPDVFPFPFRLPEQELISKLEGDIFGPIDELKALGEAVRRKIHAVEALEAA